MADPTPFVTVDDDLDLAEERFLLMVQTGIQRMLNAKDLRYRDLAHRLGVSESRVSQMFGEDATNLTIRTVARIYHHLGECPVLLSRRDYATLSGATSDAAPSGATWRVTASDMAGMLAAHAEVVDCDDEVGTIRPPRHSDWIAAAPAMLRRA